MPSLKHRCLGAVVSATALLSVACREPRVVYRTVEVPTPVPCPQPPVIEWPVLPIRNLTKNSTPDEVAKAYVLSVEILKQQLWSAIEILNSYRTPVK